MNSIKVFGVQYHEYDAGHYYQYDDAEDRKYPSRLQLSHNLWSTSDGYESQEPEWAVFKCWASLGFIARCDDFRQLPVIRELAWEPREVCGYQYVQHGSIWCPDLSRFELDGWPDALQPGADTQLPLLFEAAMGPHMYCGWSDHTTTGFCASNPEGAFKSYWHRHLNNSQSFLADRQHSLRRVLENYRTDQHRVRQIGQLVGQL